MDIMYNIFLRMLTEQKYSFPMGMGRQIGITFYKYSSPYGDGILWVGF